jgi:hypothetical protein
VSLGDENSTNPAIIERRDRYDALDRAR